MKNGICYFKTEKSENVNFTRFCLAMVQNLPSVAGLNMLFILTSIPIFTCGASFCAMSKVLTKIIYDQPADIIGDYFTAFKKDFKQGSFCFAIQSLSFLTAGLAIYFYAIFSRQGAVFYIPLILSVCLLIILFSASVYLYPLISTVKLQTKNILKNALILGLCKIKAAILPSAFSILFIFVSTALFPYSLPFTLFLGFGLYSALCVYAALPIISREIISK